MNQTEHCSSSHTAPKTPTPSSPHSLIIIINNKNNNNQGSTPFFLFSLFALSQILNALFRNWFAMCLNQVVSCFILSMF